MRNYHAVDIIIRKDHRWGEIDRLLQLNQGNVMASSDVVQWVGPGIHYQCKSRTPNPQFFVEGVPIRPPPNREHFKKKLEEPPPFVIFMEHSIIE